ncbi:MAG: hypothetical protein H6962_12280 [Chromatiaceae bacterium]|nr:hypothetical protein [Chromatiaceae bacterium]
MVIESGIQDTFLHARYLHELVKVQNFIQAMDASLSATSFADYLALLNGAFLESENAGVPRSNDEIAELMIFLDHDRVSGYANEDYSQVRIQVRHNIATTDALRKTLGKIRALSTKISTLA